jgi:ACS family tartrate transporter-like MFS transporter
MQTDLEIGRRARGRVAVRLLPFVFIMYVICYLDRANLSFANLRMSADLGFSDRIYGLGSGIFFLGYVLFEIPGAIIVERWSARKWMARIMISWGIVTILTGFIHSARQFYLARFFLGVAEASFFPGIIVYLTHWFRSSDRAKAIGFFYAAVPAASVVGSLMASWLLGIHWSGVAGWRWIFIIEGIPPVLLGIVTIFYLTDWPEQARWLSKDERDWISGEIGAEVQAKMKIRNYTIWQAFRDKRVILLMVPYFLALTGAQASVFWIPTFIRRLSGLPGPKVALWVALPGLVGIASMLLNGWHSDKTGERRWHTAIPLAVAGVDYLLLSGTHDFPMVIALLIVGGCMFGYYPVFWSMPTLFLSESAAAACFGLINSVGHTGGFIGPSAVGYLNDRTGSMTGAFLFIGACYLLASCIVPAIKIGSSVSPAMPISLTQKEIPERRNNPICWVDSDRACS